MSSNNLQQLIEQIAEADNNVQKGKDFERLVKFYLQNDPQRKQQFKQVYLWNEWPKRDGADTGVDLVAEGYQGEYCAVQAKCYHPDTTLPMLALGNFFTTSGRKPFTERLIVSTTDKVSKNLEKQIKKQQIPCTRIGTYELQNSPIEWPDTITGKPKLKAIQKKKLRPHQKKAVDDVIRGLATADRGRLIMACGTGKTFTSLKIAEKMAGIGGNVLFLVPSISLLSQTLREWATEAEIPLRNFAVCSDTKVNKNNEDISMYELAIPATTQSDALAKKLKQTFGPDAERLNVVFSTYHSIGIIQEAQQKGAPEFDLVICDEAHRTTGVESKEQESSYFIKIHDQRLIRAKKRLYMTATPRLYDAQAKDKAKQHDMELCSMDDPTKYGEELYRLDFSEAVKRGLLSDYKVLVLTIDESAMAAAIQSELAQHEGLKLGDAAKLIGCWNGLAKKFGNRTTKLDTHPMRRAVAFSRLIKDSKQMEDIFNRIIEEYKRKGGFTDDSELVCRVKHVDGKMNALQRNNALQWLKDESPDNTCHILSNARCLSEGVDVPALDAVIFLSPRNSQVDVVQAVGRVMRKAEGKKLGYVILPVVIPSNMPPEEALSDDKNYKVVWQVLQALRAHDNRFNAIINKIELNKTMPDEISVIGVGGELGEGESQAEALLPLPFPDFEQWRDAIYARVVVKCGDRRYWEDWAKDVAAIAQTNITRIKALLAASGKHYRELFDEFLDELRTNLNPEVSEADAIEMLSQHIITRPVFNALFENYDFTKQNPVSIAMQIMLELLDEQGLKSETQKLDKFYDSVRERASGIDNLEGKQKIMLELYEKFFSTAFKKDSQRLGIVYTPVEAVDFILASADAISRQEFGKGLTEKDIHILDPFTGTGTFISRLLQSDLIKDSDLERKYRKELHANEIVLLAYYIAAINIEESYHDRSASEYVPFEGIVLSDTFQLNENDDTLTEQIFDTNSERAQKQKNDAIRVIVGNPPYSAGQRSENDANQNLKYERLDNCIAESYVAYSTMQNNNSLYDSYIRAIRWASDRIGDMGIVAFITNGSFIDGNAAAGLRQGLCEDFSAIYCLNLRGGIRGKEKEVVKREGEGIFGQSSQATIAITLFIKKKGNKNECQLHYHDIGDYLTRQEKLAKLKEFAHYKNIVWQSIQPNPEHDWINQRDPQFTTYLPIGDKANKKRAGSVASIFTLYSSGLKTNRDKWVYHFSRQAVADNMQKMIDFYNQQRTDFQIALQKNNRLSPNDFINNDPKRISWTPRLKSDLANNKMLEFDDHKIRLSLYRPFSKQWLYFDHRLNERLYRMPAIFPTAESDNLAICVCGIGATKDFSALMVNTLPNLHFMDSSQCFPLYRYANKGGGLFDSEHRQDNIPDDTLQRFREHYREPAISKEAIFYYVYGLLHSPEYKQRYAADLKKMLPHIPYAKDFGSFSNIGRALAELHLHYESGTEYPLSLIPTSHNEQAKLKLAEFSDDKIVKAKFAGKRGQPDKSTIIYNHQITLSGIPTQAYDYIVNGKSAIEWLMDRYKITLDKDSGIQNNPNDYSEDPQYIIKLFKQVTHLSVESAKLIKSLSELTID